MHENSVVTLSKDFVSVDLEDEIVLLNLTSGIYFGLAGVGSRVWNLMKTPKTVGNLLKAITGEYAVSPEQCERDLAAFLAQLVNEGLIEITDNSNT